MTEEKCVTLTISENTYYRLLAAARAKFLTPEQFLDELAAQLPEVYGPFDGDDFERIMGMGEPTPDDAER